MNIPVYVMSGFLESGKTRLINFLNQEIKHSREDDENHFLIQFEKGFTKAQTYSWQQEFSILKKDLKDRNAVIDNLRSKLLEATPDYCFIEYNGTYPLEDLYDFVDAFNQGDITLDIIKIIYCFDPKKWATLSQSSDTTIYLKQLSEADIVYIHELPKEMNKKHLLYEIREMNPHCKIHLEDKSLVLSSMQTRGLKEPFIFILMMILALDIYLLTYYFSLKIAFPFSNVISVFVGIMLQGIPFLLIGVMLSAAIQLFVTPRMIEKFFPKNLMGGMIVSLFAGLLLPVCDCASVPIFHSLMKKKVPLPATITFLLSAPIMNPVVILSTYYAFGGNQKMVILRMGLGLITAFLVGLTFLKVDSESIFLSQRLKTTQNYQSLEINEALKGKHFSKFYRYFNFVRIEFINILKYLVMGAAFSSLLQLLIQGNPALLIGKQGEIIAILGMMLISFLLSLCSSSDAVVARTYDNLIPVSGILGFLVYGPMIDIKNWFMLSAYFKKSFVLRLMLSTTIITFTIIFTYAILTR